MLWKALGLFPTPGTQFPDCVERLPSFLVWTQSAPSCVQLFVQKLFQLSLTLHLSSDSCVHECKKLLCRGAAVCTESASVHARQMVSALLPRSIKYKNPSVL